MPVPVPEPVEHIGETCELPPPVAGDQRTVHPADL
jgi:hypothetical protein